MTSTVFRVRVRATYEEDTEIELDVYDLIREELIGMSSEYLPFDVDSAQEWDFDILGQNLEGR